MFAGGDIFIHAKSSNYSKLYELSQAVMCSFPEGSIEKAEDIYGWTYQEGRDLSGFIDGMGRERERERERERRERLVYMGYGFHQLVLNF